MEELEKLLSPANADPTNAVYRAAWEVFNDFQRQRNDPLIWELTMEDVEGENLLHLFNSYVRYLIHTDIPKKYSRTKTLYFSKFKETMRVKFKDHELMKNEFETNYGSKLYEAVSIGSQRHHMNSIDDSNDSRALPFYPRIRPELVPAGDREKILHGDSKYATDMHSLCHILLSESDTAYSNFNHAGPLQKRLWLVITMLAVGRAGELKFIRYDEMHWDPHLQMLNMTWSEPKTLNSYEMLFGPSNFDFALDFFHACGSFFAVEDGLYRQSNGHHSKDNFLFPIFHGKGFSSIPAKISHILKTYVHPTLRDLITSRSIRRGGATCLQEHRGVTGDELNARGGWADATNSKFYREITPLITLAGDIALNQWKDTRTPKFAPSLRAIPAVGNSTIDALLRSLFMISDRLPYFQPEGRLRPFLEACAASLIMYHPDLVKRHSVGHPVAKRLLKAVEDATGAKEPATLLSYWSRVIRDDFQTKNPDISDASESHLKEVIQDQSDLLRKVNLVISKLQTSLEGQQDIIVGLEHSMENLKKRMRNMDSVKSVREGNPTASDLVDTGHGISDPDVSEIESPRKRVGRLKKSSVGIGTDERKGKDVTLSALLRHIYEEYFDNKGIQLEGMAFITNIKPPQMKESDKVKHALELIELALTKEQKETLAKPNLPDKELKKLCAEVETKSMLLIRELCVKAGAERQKLGSKSEGRHKANYMGIGRRINQLKTKALENTMPTALRALSTYTPGSKEGADGGDRGADGGGRGRARGILGFGFAVKKTPT